ncbi:histidinol-phosphate transaminase [Acrocarpospora corrugata]|uniref:Histidinol-phosphate aminotransferase n=1 Tax=Acrocarpospora corrugata TaxID=35763 RepID=A0A5M3VVX8_9ACTN|nr:histidinol-phosphate transaminase [Acrocarpospora corrugata]GES00654.1 histidinol-phosphate transaminase [Acrocarpospora corrugata]
MTRSIQSFVRPGFADAAPYNATHHDFAWRRRELARMMSNECPIPPSPAVLRAVADAMAVGHLYPYSGQDLRAAVAAHCGAPVESVVLGNGSTEILDVLTRVLTGPGDETIIPTPTYAFFETQSRLCGSTPVFVPLTEAWELDVDAVLRAITPRTKIIFLCSPNNPTGKGWTVEQVERLAATGIPVIIDQAYLECGYGQSFAHLVADHPNLVTTRTMSKGFGLAALRVGYAIADPWLADVVERVRIPFSVSLMAIWGCLAAFAEPDELERRRRHISGEADRLYKGLQAMDGVTAYPSEGNFVLADISGTGREVLPVVDAVLSQRILIRAMSAHRLRGSHLRVTVGTEEQNDRFLDILPAILGTGS